MSFREYVLQHAIRGECTCGRCIDASPAPEEHQPTGHTADLIFFRVAQNGASADEFLNLVKAEFPQYLDGKEHSYIEIGADLGDQGLALMAMGLGKLLGIWELLTPAMLGIPKDLELDLAGSGLVTIQRTRIQT